MGLTRIDGQYVTGRDNPGSIIDIQLFSPRFDDPNHVLFVNMNWEGTVTVGNGNKLKVNMPGTAKSGEQFFHFWLLHLNPTPSQQSRDISCSRPAESLLLGVQA